MGEDERGPWMGLTGLARYTIAFTHNYEIRPLLKLHAGDGRIEAEVAIRNLKHTPMELMYLAHVNFRPHDGAQAHRHGAGRQREHPYTDEIAAGPVQAERSHKAMLAATGDQPGAAPRSRGRAAPSIPKSSWG